MNPALAGTAVSSFVSLINQIFNSGSSSTAAGSDGFDGTTAGEEGGVYDDDEGAIYVSEDDYVEDDGDVDFS